MFYIYDSIESDKLIHNLKNFKNENSKIKTKLHKLPHVNNNSPCLICGATNNIYRLTITDSQGESAFFMLLCSECAKEIANSILSTHTIH